MVCRRWSKALISKYGYTAVLRVIGFAIVVDALSLLFVGEGIVKIGVLAFTLFLVLFVLYFFRDPVRITPSGDHLVLSPADGKVVLVKNVWEEEFLRSEAVQISIFLSPLNIHVNRIPISGRVHYFRYVKGDYLVAFHEKASEKNERTLIGIENGKFKILMRQVAGFIARRIVCSLHVDDIVKAGERFGMIKFGSRVDILVPVQAELKVGLNDRVVAGETILAAIRS